MNISIFTPIRFVLALLTVLAIAFRSHIPPKIWHLPPDARVASHIFGPVDAKGASSVSWINRADNQWRCHYKPQFGSDNCGMIMMWNKPVSDVCSGFSESTGCPGPEPADAGGIPLDFSEYDGLRLRIHYEGRARFLRLYLRNQHPDYAAHASMADGKLMSAIIRTDDLKAGPIYVDLREFVVAEGWVREANVSRQQALSGFGYVTGLGIELIEHGVHRIRVDSLELVGQRITSKALPWLILIFWSAALLFEGAAGCYRYFHKAAPDKSGKPGVV